MFRHVGLNINFARQLMTSRSTCHLGEQLERFFRRTEIRKVQRRVRCYNSNKRHIRKIQTFGDHLRTEQHIAFLFPKGLK
ncbi:hypothetical protein D3C77_406020 [compost metagenome]